MSDNDVVCSMSRSDDLWDNVTMENFLSWMKTGQILNKVYRTRDNVRADVFA
jgi:hypothetical protein